MSSSLKRLLNDDDDLDYRAVRQYARSTTGSPTRSPEAGHLPSPGTLRDVFGDLASVPRSAHIDIAGPTLGGISIIERHLEAFKQDLVSRGSSTSSSLSTPSSLSPHSTFPLHSPAPASVASSEGLTDVEDETIVCYGMIPNVDVKLVGDMGQLDARLAAQPRAASQRFSLVDYGDHIMLAFANDPTNAPGLQLGYLRSHMRESLGHLLSRPDVELQAVASSSGLRDTICGFRKSSDAVVQVNMCLYGPRGVAKTIGRLLSRSRLYLQTPNGADVRPGVPYDNPQRISFWGGGRERSQPRRDELLPRSGSDERMTRLIDSVYGTCGSYSPQREKPAQQHQQLHQHQQQPYTQLLPHQEEALDFMLYRETAVTEGAKGLGGVIADEKGLGKTLMALSLIFETKQMATQWASQEAGGRDTQTHNPSTLVVVPRDLTDHWMREANLHMGKSLAVSQYDLDQEQDIVAAETADVVVTTHDALAADFSHKRNMFRKAWFRVVVDEADFIAGAQSLFHRACCSLDARARWCLTSTPVKSRLVEDLSALFSFLRCASSRESVEHLGRDLETSKSGDTDILCDRLSKILQPVMLRRLRDRVDDAFQHDEAVVALDLGAAERDSYDRVAAALARTIASRQKATGRATNAMPLFAANVELRLAASHGSPDRVDTREYREAAATALALVCSSCAVLITAQAFYSPQCRHSLCAECHALSCAQRGEGATTRPLGFSCPSCAATKVASPVTVQVDDTSDEESTTPRGNVQSTKMERLVQDLTALSRGTKSIVFSCWTLSLDLLARYLSEKGISFRQIRDHVPLAQRRSAVKEFAQDTGAAVLLLTTGTGVFGLNLEFATNVFIMEPQWSRYIEKEAIARAVGLCRERRVHVVRYVIKDTVEETWLRCRDE